MCVSSLSKLLVARLKEAFNNAKLKRDDELRNSLILTTGEIGRYRWPFVPVVHKSTEKAPLTVLWSLRMKRSVFFRCVHRFVLSPLLLSERLRAVWCRSLCCVCSTVCCPSRLRCLWLRTLRSEPWPLPKVLNFRPSSVSTRTLSARYKNRF